MARLRGLLVCLIFSILPVSGFAQVYVGGHGGITIQPDNDLSFAGSTLDIEVVTDAGFNAGAVAGYDFGSYRVEGEVTYFSNDIDDLTVNGVSASGIGLSLIGDVSAWMIFVNAWYDFDTGTRFTPYIGAGAGALIVEVALGAPGLGLPRTSETDTTFGGQFGVGTAINIIPKLDATVDYRFLIGADAEFNGVDVEVMSHTFRVGLRYTF